MKISIKIWRQESRLLRAMQADLQNDITEKERQESRLLRAMQAGLLAKLQKILKLMTLTVNSNSIND